MAAASGATTTATLLAAYPGSMAADLLCQGERLEGCGGLCSKDGARPRLGALPERCDAACRAVGFVRGLKRKVASVQEGEKEVGVCGEFKAVKGDIPSVMLQVQN